MKRPTLSGRTSAGVGAADTPRTPPAEGNVFPGTSTSIPPGAIDPEQTYTDGATNFADAVLVELYLHSDEASVLRLTLASGPLTIRADGVAFKASTRSEARFVETLPASMRPGAIDDRP